MPNKPLSRSQSLFLDIVRISAACIVAGSHLTQHYFCAGLPDLTFLARASVAVFFVLSGFVIRYSTVRRPSTLTNYLKERATRIYSVAIPALLFTLLADTVAHHTDPRFYAYWAAKSSHPLLRLCDNLLFTAQLWNRDISPLSNSPFWSLNYEAAYYVLYGCLFYLRGTARWLWSALVALLIGPKILLVFPVWLIGCVAHDLYQAWGSSRRATTALHWATLSAPLLGGSSVLAILADSQLRHSLLYFRGTAYREAMHLGLGMTGAGLSFYGVGIFGSILFLRLLVAVRSINLQERDLLVRAIRWIADGTFPIYLLHFPLYVLIAATLPYDHASRWQLAMILCGVLMIGMCAAPGCNRLRRTLRSVLDTDVWHRKQLAKDVAAAGG